MTFRARQRSRLHLVQAYGRPTVRASVVDEPATLLDCELVDDLLVEDAEVEVRAFPGVVRAGLGATVWAHPGVVVDAEDGATVYLATGASLEEWRPGALERGTVSIIPWDPDPQTPGTWGEDDPVRRCSVCGCTDEHACPGSCWWVAANLCSTCLPVVDAARTTHLSLSPVESRTHRTDMP